MSEYALAACPCTQPGAGNSDDDVLQHGFIELITASLISLCSSLLDILYTEGDKLHTDY
jgi:hypothetical protein